MAHYTLKSSRQEVSVTLRCAVCLDIIPSSGVHAACNTHFLDYVNQRSRFHQAASQFHGPGIAVTSEDIQMFQDMLLDHPELRRRYELTGTLC